MLKRRNGSAGPGTNDDTEKKSKKRRLVVLRWWAITFALLVASALGAATACWFDRSGAAWAVAVVIATPVMIAANMLTVGPAHDRAPAWSWPWLRIALGSLLAVAVAYAVVLWQFSDDVTIVRNADITRWDREVPSLSKDLGDAQKIASRPVSTVDADAQVQGKTSVLAGLKQEAAKARADELCEHEGTCGTRVYGRAGEYYERKAWAEEMERRVAAAEKELTDLRAAVAIRVEQENHDRDLAVGKVADIKLKLAAFGPKPSEPRNAFSSAWAVGQQKSVPVGGWFVGGVLACMLLDVGAFLFVVWRTCRREVSR